jgi:hypothetical protein
MSPAATRRGLLALAPALAALAPASTASATPHPDAELLAACARFRALNAEVAAVYSAGYTAEFPDDDAREEFRDAREPAFLEALDAIVACRATTLEGVIARGLALAEFTPEKVADDFETPYWDELQLHALLRDLVAMAQATPD